MSAHNSDLLCLRPDWPTPAGVRAAFTVRTGGVSAAPYNTLNLAAHVGDRPQDVQANRERLRAALRLPSEPAWLEQIHGTDVVEIGAHADTASLTADAAIARAPGAVAVVQVADCLPVLFTSVDGSCVAVAHAGWRGLAAGVLERLVARLALSPTQLLVWIGPGISVAHFEVGAEVREAFINGDTDAAQAFIPNSRGRWQCDLTMLAKQRLRKAGVTRIFGAAWCTYGDADRFFSFRRDGRCGRMAALIWRS